MKELYINGEKTGFVFAFFMGQENKEQLIDWLRKAIINDLEVLNLSDAHSCEVKVYEDGDIIINGDEDYKEIEFKDFIPITL